MKGEVGDQGQPGVKGETGQPGVPGTPVSSSRVLVHSKKQLLQSCFTAANN